MDRTVTALLPRGPQTAVLPVPRGTLEHPSFVNALPAIIAEPVDVGYCEVCAWLASEIRKADDRGDWARVADHARTAIGHVAAAHPSYGIDELSPNGFAQTRHNLGGAS